MTGKISEDADVTVTSSTKFAAVEGGTNKGPLMSSISSYLASLIQTLTNKTINASNNTISNLTTAMFASNVVDTDGTLAANSDSRLASQKAVKTYVGGYHAAGAGISISSNVIQVDGAFGFRNRLINPTGQIAQIAVGSQTDATYDFDQWLTLTQTAAVTVSQVTNAEDGTPFMMRSLQAQATAQRFGRIQWIESANCIDLRGKTVTLSARARMSASTTLRFAIVEWTGTADTITKDVVNDWTSGTFTAGNFFNSTTLTISAAGSQALTANTIASVSLTANISSSANNVAIIFWTDSAQAQNVTLDIGRVQHEIGASATQFAWRPYATELMLCQRYLNVIAPGVTGANVASGGVSGTIGYFPVLWPTMFKVPTVTLSANADWNVNPFYTGSSQQNGSAVAFSGTNKNGTRIQLTTSSTGAGTGAMAALETTNTSAQIIVKAQL